MSADNLITEWNGLNYVFILTVFMVFFSLFAAIGVNVSWNVKLMVIFFRAYIKSYDDQEMLTQLRVSSDHACSRYIFFGIVIFLIFLFLDIHSSLEFTTN